MDAALAKTADRARQELVKLDANEVWVPERCRARHKPAGQMWRSDLQLDGHGEWKPCVCEGQMRVGSPGAPGGSTPLTDRELVARREEKQKKRGG